MKHVEEFDSTLAGVGVTPEPGQTEISSLARRAIKKAKFRLMPLILLMYLLAFIDRSNIGMAALTMNQSLGLTPEHFGFAVGIFSFGYILFEIPSNVLLERYGARFWLARIMITWGIISMAMAFAQGVVTLSILRFLLGVAEAGLAPGIVFYLTTWFPKKELAKVFSIYYLGVPLAAIIANPISGYILDNFHNVGGLESWQWLFLIEGCPPVILSVVVFLYLTDKPSKASWLKPEERQAYQDLMEKDQQATLSAGHSGFREMIKDRRVWLLGMAYFFTVIGLTGLGFWMPQFIKRFDYSDTVVGMLGTIPYIAGAVVMCWWSNHSDKTNERTWHFILPSLLFSVGFVVAAISDSPVISMVGLTLSTVGMLSCVPTFYTLPASFLTSRGCAGGMALINSIGNIGGFFGPFLVGLVISISGKSQSGLYLLAVLVLFSPLLIYLMSRNRRQIAGWR
ncbi:MFS transporter [Leclercia adecarboxylata]|uniref:MFS transporter n=1 Tax=Leclercia TaxID=83654 RepID=UPI001BDCCAF0|nr:MULTISPECIES: MFS transporter [Leclercia]MCZ7841166.1 MFS transporter [Leclercia adecarboxylata]QVV59597.1 MFS transporter [Leclercia sp. Colony189]